MPTNVRDPRTIVTPDAFEIDPALLGLPLAPPGRRFWAMAVDMAVVGTLTAVLSSVQLLLWTVIGLVLLRLALRGRGRPVGEAAGLVLRLAVGCLGLGILGIALLVFAVAPLSDGREGAVERRVASALESAAAAGAGDDETVRALSGVDMADADGPEEAVALFETVLEGLEEAPLAASLKRRILVASVPPTAPWAGQADSLVDVAMARSAAGDAGPGGPDPEAEPDPFVDVSAAADTIEALSGEVADLRRALEAERSAREELAAELESGGSGAAALATLLRDVWEQLGSAIGLWSIYFTVLLTVWNGQTVGKRLLGIRVVGLDGSRIGWWHAFERAGGYVAGLATGLLGFAQVFWDPNRQCIHDKIVGTVVVDERAERVPGAWQEAWAATATHNHGKTEP